jgi:hypothetical protein
MPKLMRVEVSFLCSIEICDAFEATSTHSHVGTGPRTRGRVESKKRGGRKRKSEGVKRRSEEGGKRRNCGCRRSSGASRRRRGRVWHRQRECVSCACVASRRRLVLTVRRELERKEEEQRRLEEEARLRCGTWIYLPVNAVI